MISRDHSVINRTLDLPASAPDWFRTSDIIRVVEVAKKYLPVDVNCTEGLSQHRLKPQGSHPRAVPEYTTPGQDGRYCTVPIEDSWTQGFFPGSIWLVAERERLLPGTLAKAGYTLQEVEALARAWQECFRHQARPAINHDQGFRFQPCYARDLELTGRRDVIPVLIEAAESLVDRYDPMVGCIRSWDHVARTGYPDEGQYHEGNLDQHYLVIIDNMMNLDLMYLASELTGDSKYADIATTQASRMMSANVRADFSTFHVANFNHDGTLKNGFTAQGYADDSMWSRGQAWGIYGYAQVALRTGKEPFVMTARKLADVFLNELPDCGVPWWDFRAPKPCPLDASAGMVAARGMQMLYLLLREKESEAALRYLAAAERLIDATLRICSAPCVSITADGGIKWGEGGWEPILKHSTINGNPTSKDLHMDTGLVYADYYLLEFENEALKIKSFLSGERDEVGVYHYERR